MEVKDIPLADFLTFWAHKKLISQLHLGEGKKSLRSKPELALSEFRSTHHRSTCFHLLNLNLKHVKGGIFYTFAYKKEKQKI